ncbi:hypothetical protein QEZ40_002485 [Streptomyces katrae]|uniref:Uncharacterized protein n=1 Tax=Streptomyces katrae TaxID=68223 RepID=A0ABT7GV87_9ACTN|nr:hypothetical protein [Streptomyces katrae]MDK9497545.1 hypothetical protein [Streptomyces katrae]
MGPTGWTIVATIAAAAIGAWAVLAAQRRKHDRADVAEIKPFTDEVDAVIEARKGGSETELKALGRRLEDFLISPPRQLKQPLEAERQRLTSYRLALAGNAGLPEVDAAIALSEAAGPLREANGKLREAVVTFCRTR